MYPEELKYFVIENKNWLSIECTDNPNGYSWKMAVEILKSLNKVRMGNDNKS